MSNTKNERALCPVDRAFGFIQKVRVLRRALQTCRPRYAGEKANPFLRIAVGNETREIKCGIFEKRLDFMGRYAVYYVGAEGAPHIAGWSRGSSSGS